MRTYITSACLFFLVLTCYEDSILNHVNLEKDTSYITDSHISEFLKVRKINCILERPQDAEAPFLLKILTNSHDVDINRNSFLSNFMINCDFYNNRKLIPINSISFGNFSTSNFKPVFVRCTTDSKYVVTIPLKFITVFMLNYLKGKDLEDELKDVDRIRICLMLNNLTPSAGKERVAVMTNEVSFSKNELLLFIAKAKNYDSKPTSNDVVNQIDN